MKGVKLQAFIRLCLGLWLFWGFFLFMGCQFSKEIQNAPVGENSYAVTDITGTVVTIPEKPERILTLSSTLDQIVLGMVPPERMAACDASLEEPEQSNMVAVGKQVKAKIQHPSVERVVSLHPDIILIADWQNLDMAEPLRDLGFKVVVCKGPRNLQQVKETIMLTAEAIGEKEKGQILLDKMDRKLAEIKAKVDAIPLEKRKKVLFLSLMGNYGGTGCSFDDACQYAGVINGVSALGMRNGQEVTKEVILAANPDVLFLPSYWRQGREKLAAYCRDYEDDPGLQTVTAVREKNFQVPRQVFIYNCSQDFVYGVQEIAYCAYGQDFYVAPDDHLSALDE